MINMNKLARKIAIEEGGRQQVNIAQIKEILRITLDLLEAERPDKVLELIYYRD